MTNEQYLIVSYFSLGLLSLGLGLLVYAWLRRSFVGVVSTLPYRNLTQVLRRLFPLGLVVPVLAAFLSVSFRSCEKDTYSKIVADRAYLVAKNQEQISATFGGAAWAVLIWGYVLLGALFLGRLRTRGLKGILFASFALIVLLLGLIILYEYN